MAAERPIPDMPIRVVVPAVRGDATQRIQSALDYVATLPPDANGIRRAAPLEEGTYHLSGSLKIAVSGVVLRGSGMGQGGTILPDTGQRRDTLICIKGKNDREIGPSVAITDAFVPVNASTFRVDASHSFHFIRAIRFWCIGPARRNGFRRWARITSAAASPTSAGSPGAAICTLENWALHTALAL